MKKKRTRIHVPCEQCWKSGIMIPKMLKLDAQLREQRVHCVRLYCARSPIFNSGNFLFFSLSFSVLFTLLLPIAISNFFFSFIRWKAQITIAPTLLQQKKNAIQMRMWLISAFARTLSHEQTMNCRKHNQLRNEDKSAMELV